mmetsp:Transcript_23375/g.50488  ORF Transcript_23375/g.50488 Transcript_23375/m.50488 type:complete len:575 (+) Transcript_23375:456-2180(+)
MAPRPCPSDLNPDLDDAPSMRKNYLLPLMTPPEADDNDDDALQQQTPLGNGKPARRNSATKTMLSQPKMVKSMSMLEMNDIQDMRLFGEEMNALSAESTVASSASDESRAREDGIVASTSQDEGGFFIETSSDHSDENADRRAVADPAMTTSSFLNNMALDSPDRTLHLPSGGGGMRRVMSMASLPSKRFGGNLKAMTPVIHTISEEEDEVLQGAMRSRTSEVGLDASENLRRPPSRQNSSSSLASSGGMPLRSSMKGSRNNLRRVTAETNSSRTPEVGLDASVSLRKPLSRQNSSSSMASGGMPLRSSMKGSRNNLLRAAMDGGDASQAFSRNSLRGSGNSSVGMADDANQVQASLDESVNGRRPSRSSRLPRRFSRSNLRGSRTNLLRSNSNTSDNDVHASFNSRTSIPSMDDTTHSFESHKDGDANLDDSIHSAQSNSNNMKRNVSFSSLEIRTYNVTLGDAPTSNGPPVSLGWDYDPDATVEQSIDHYENYRAEAPRRNKHEMLMPAAHREYLLMREAGFSRGEIKVAMYEAQRTAKQREKTVRGVMLGLQPVQEVLEKTKRRLAFGKKR